MAQHYISSNAIFLARHLFFGIILCLHQASSRPMNTTAKVDQKTNLENTAANLQNMAASRGVTLNLPFGNIKTPFQSFGSNSKNRAGLTTETGQPNVFGALNRTVILLNYPESDLPGVENYPPPQLAARKFSLGPNDASASLKKLIQELAILEIGSTTDEITNNSSENAARIDDRNGGEDVEDRSVLSSLGVPPIATNFDFLPSWDMPMSVINMPFYNMRMPFSITDAARIIPPQAEVLRNRVANPRPRTGTEGLTQNPRDGPLPNGNMGLESFKNGSIPDFDLTKRALDVIGDLPGIGPDGNPVKLKDLLARDTLGVRGNLDDAIASEVINSKLTGWPQKVRLPLGILNMPLSMLSAPLSGQGPGFGAPMSRSGATDTSTSDQNAQNSQQSAPQGQDGTQTADSGNNGQSGGSFPGAGSDSGSGDGSSAQNLPNSPNPGIGSDAQFSGQASDAQNQASARIGAAGDSQNTPSDNSFGQTTAGQDDTPITLPHERLPYSFLNMPLGFFNLPFAYTNLPLSQMSVPFLSMFRSAGNDANAVHPQSLIDLIHTLKASQSSGPLAQSRSALGQVSDASQNTTGTDMAANDEADLGTKMAAVSIPDGFVERTASQIWKLSGAGASQADPVIRPASTDGLLRSLKRRSIPPFLDLTSKTPNDALKDDEVTFDPSQRSISTSNDSLSTQNSTANERANVSPVSGILSPFDDAVSRIVKTASLASPTDRASVPGNSTHLKNMLNDLIMGKLSASQNASFRSANTRNVLKEIVGQVDELLRSSIPTAPDLASFMSVPKYLLSAPAGLLSNPLGLLDVPLGKMNLPLSHFNFPFSHFGLPSAGHPSPGLGYGHTLGMGPHDMVGQAEHVVPPSLLELLAKSNPLQSYVNLPLSEMNLPLGIFDLPLSMVDLPFMGVQPHMAPTSPLFGASLDSPYHPDAHPALMGHPLDLPHPGQPQIHDLLHNLQSTQPDLLQNGALGSVDQQQIQQLLTLLNNANAQSGNPNLATKPGSGQPEIRDLLHNAGLQAQTGIQSPHPIFGHDPGSHPILAQNPGSHQFLAQNLGSHPNLAQNLRGIHPALVDHAPLP